jgi:hypothetical protein
MKFLDYLNEKKKDFNTLQDAISFFFPHQDFIFIYHETPLENVVNIMKSGLKNDSNFATIQTPSNFVISKSKAIVKISIPKNKWHYLSPDMRYDPEDALNDIIKQHPKLIGADVSYNDQIPVKSIVNITIIKDGKSEVIWPSDFNKYQNLKK